jgi:uncharacterized protein (TIGR00369 family)
MDDNPLLDYLGIELVEWKPGRAIFELDVQARHLNRQGTLQGGVTATLLDAACGYAGLLRESDQEPQNAVTVMLTISYMAKVQAGRLRAVGEVTTAGRKIFFASGTLSASDGRVIATSQGTFKLASGKLASGTKLES